MNDLLVDPFAHQQMRVYDLAYGFVEHCGEHYGQLVGLLPLGRVGPPGVATEEVSSSIPSED